MDQANLASPRFNLYLPDLNFRRTLLKFHTRTICIHFDSGSFLEQFLQLEPHIRIEREDVSFGPIVNDIVAGVSPKFEVQFECSRSTRLCIFEDYRVKLYSFGVMLVRQVKPTEDNGEDEVADVVGEQQQEREREQEGAGTGLQEVQYEGPLCRCGSVHLRVNAGDMVPPLGS